MVLDTILAFGLFGLLEKWKMPVIKGYIGAVLMDLAKAFDTINHELYNKRS